MASRQAIEDWLARYGRAWEGRNGDEAAALFTPDGVYWWGPFEEPCRGRDAIRSRWEEAVAAQRDVRFETTVLGFLGEQAVAHWHCVFGLAGAPGGIELDGVFFITLDANGLCTEFKEWWNQRETAG
jgi:uncharacterized protein (TIGR02246 family)